MAMMGAIDGGSENECRGGFIGMADTSADRQTGRKQPLGAKGKHAGICSFHSVQNYYISNPM